MNTTFVRISVNTTSLPAENSIISYKLRKNTSVKLKTVEQLKLIAYLRLSYSKIIQVPFMKRRNQQHSQLTTRLPTNRLHLSLQTRLSQIPCLDLQLPHERRFHSASSHTVHKSELINFFPQIYNCCRSGDPDLATILSALLLVWLLSVHEE